MKHPTVATVKMVVLVCALSAILILGSEKFASESASVAAPPTLIFAAIIIFAFAIGTLFWWLALKYKWKFSSRVLFSISIGVLFARTLSVFFGDFSIVFRVLFAMVNTGLFYYIVGEFKKEEYSLLPLNNIYIGLVSITIGGIFGALLPPIVAIGVFFIAAIYDAFAVWKSKHMQVLAKGLIANGIIPALAVSYRDSQNKVRLALLGGGDLFFLSFIVSSFAVQDYLMSVIVGVMVTLSIIYLFLASTKDRFYPALPFMFGGMVVAFPIWFVIVQVVSYVG